MSHLNAWVKGYIRVLWIPGHWAALSSLGILSKYQEGLPREVHSRYILLIFRWGVPTGPVNARTPHVFLENPSLLLHLRLSLGWFQPSLVTHTHRELRVSIILLIIHSRLCNCLDYIKKGLYNTVTMNIMQLLFRQLIMHDLRNHRFVSFIYP